MKESDWKRLGVSSWALAVLFAVLVTQAAPAAQQPAPPKGTLERITVHGRALEGNLEGDSPDRPVVVYLPPSYATDATRRYPVLYFLHGYTATAEAYVKSLAVPDSIDRAVAAGAREMIVVIPDAFTKYSGSMFSNSPTTGDWETFIARDLTDIHRQAVSHHRVTRRPWPRRPLDGRLRHDSHRHEAAGGVRGALCDELVLSDERSGRARRRAWAAR